MKRAREKISAVLEFSERGSLKAILLNSESEADQRALQAGLSRLFKPSCIDLVRGALKSGK